MLYVKLTVTYQESIFFSSLRLVVDVTYYLIRNVDISFNFIYIYIVVLNKCTIK